MLDDIYNDEFFDMHVPWKSDYAYFADLLRKQFRFKTVLDLGCGNGYLISYLQGMGKTVTGVDGASRSNYYSHIPIRIADLTQDIYFGDFDLVLCLEVAEHIDAFSADQLVENITRSANSLIVFSAATAGYGGLHHVNEQPKKYWLEKFGQYDFTEDRKASFQLRWNLRQCEHTWWFSKNVMVLTNAANEHAKGRRRI